MKLDTLVFLESRDALLPWLKKLRASSLHKVDGGFCFYCHLVSSESYYLCVKVPYPTKDEPKAWVSIWIPHGSVRLTVRPDRPVSLGFAPSA